MFQKKVYGASKTEKCPFCDRPAFSVNKQGVPVCQDHKNQNVDFRCICGEWLELKKSKWGVFFVCVNCGTISMHKALEMNSGIKTDAGEEKTEEEARTNFVIDRKIEPGSDSTSPEQLSNKKGRKETTIRSDDSFYFS
jgi:hypothetical protein